MVNTSEDTGRTPILVVVALMLAVCVAMSAVPLAYAAWAVGLSWLGMRCAPAIRGAVVLHLALFGFGASLFLGEAQWLWLVPGAYGVALVLPRRFPAPVYLMLVTAMPLIYLSGAGGGPGGWNNWFAELLRLTPEQAEALVWWVRKGLHFGVYGVLAWTAAKALESVGVVGSPLITSAALWTLSHASFDELRQATTPGRTGSWVDFLIDATGMAAFLWPWWGRRIASPPEPR